MEIRVLGCDGGHGQDARATSLLVNDTVLIDAGNILSALSDKEMLEIGHLFLSHSHLDHIYDFPFFLDATFARGVKPLPVYGSDHTLSNLRSHVFNNVIWPDLASLPDSGAQYVPRPLLPGQTVDVAGLHITPVPVNHIVPTYGYLIEDDEGAVLFSSDTGPCNEFWRIANACEKLKAVIVDLAFPNAMQNVADLSGHHTPDSLAKDLKKLRVDCDVYAFHFKVGMMDEIRQEMANVTHRNIPVKALRDFDKLVF